MNRDVVRVWIKFLLNFYFVPEVFHQAIGKFKDFKNIRRIYMRFYLSLNYGTILSFYMASF